MIVLFSLAFFTSIILLVIGLIKPKLAFRSSRKKVFLLYIPIIIICFFGAIITAEPVEKALPKEHDQTNKEHDQTNQENKKGQDLEKKKLKDNEVKDGPLTKIGQWAKEDDGTKVTLKNIVSPEETLDLDPIKLTLHDVKLLERVGGNKDGNVIQISYTVENVSDKEIMFHAIKMITTNTKRQIDVMLENVSMEAGPGEYYGEVKEEGFIVVPYPEESFEGLSSIKLITGDVWDNNRPEKYHESLTKEIIFE